MSILNELGITVGKNNIAEKIFEDLFPSFFEVEYKKPSEYVSKYWNAYEIIPEAKRNKNLNGRMFEYILATLFVRENILPLYLSAKVAFVPNVIYDLMFYTFERGPICISAKTSLRERYKQADLEAIALKYVHRKSLSYLVTIKETEAAGVKKKIENGDVIGLDDVIVATKNEFNDFINALKSHVFSKPPVVEVIKSKQIVTKEKLQIIKKQNL